MPGITSPLSCTTSFSRTLLSSPWTSWVWPSEMVLSTHTSNTVNTINSLSKTNLLANLDTIFLNHNFLLAKHKLPQVFGYQLLLSVKLPLQKSSIKAIHPPNLMFMTLESHAHTLPFATTSPPLLP